MEKTEDKVRGILNIMVGFNPDYCGEDEDINEAVTALMSLIAEAVKKALSPKCNCERCTGFPDLYKD